MFNVHRILIVFIEIVDNYSSHFSHGTSSCRHFFFLHNNIWNVAIHSSCNSYADLQLPIVKDEVMKVCAIYDGKPAHQINSKVESTSPPFLPTYFGMTLEFCCRPCQTTNDHQWSILWKGWYLNTSLDTTAYKDPLSLVASLCRIHLSIY